MQLIMDTEPTADITDKMSSFEESFDSKINSIDSIKNDITNGNKENIESQKNIIEETTTAVNGDDIKTTDDSSETRESEIIKAVNESENQPEDSKTKDEDNSNGVHVSESDLIEQNDEDEITLVEDENVNQQTGTKDNAISDETVAEDDAVKISDNEEDQSAMVLDDIQIVEDAVPNSSLNISEDIIMCKSDNISDTASKIVDEDIMDVDQQQSSEKVCITDNETVSDTEKMVVEDNINTDISAVSVENPDEGSKEDQNTETLNEREKEDSVEIKEANTAENTGKCEADGSSKERNLKDLELNVAETEKGTANETSDSIAPKVSQSKIEKPKQNTNSSTVENGEKTCENKNENGDVVIMATNKLDKEHGENKENITKTTSLVSAERRTDSIKPADEAVTECEPIQVENKESEDILDIDEFLEGTDVVAEEIEDHQDLELEKSAEQSKKTIENTETTVQAVEPKKAPICKLSNTLDILSDDDEEPPQIETKNNTEVATTAVEPEKQCINIEDDDDIMLIDDVTDNKDSTIKTVETVETSEKKEVNVELGVNGENSAGDTCDSKIVESAPEAIQDSTVPDTAAGVVIEEAKPAEIQEEKIEVPKKPLLAENFMKGYKKNLADMTREELEEFCILKIVEGIVDRSNLSDIKSKLKAMAQNIDEYKKKAMMLTKQNRDLQLVLKSVQEEQKKNADSAIIPLKITRSVGMQVLMTEKPNMRRKSVLNAPTTVNNSVNNKVSNNRTNNQGPRAQKTATNNQQQIPVPRLVPAATNPAAKPSNVVINTNIPKTPSQSPLNGIKAPSPVQKSAEKRPFNRAQSVTVDLTDDEPPSKVTPRSSPAPPVRLVSPQNLLTRPQFAQSLNSPRKVYIPISGPQGQNIRPGQTILLKSVPPPPGQRMRGPAPHAARLPQNPVRLTRVANSRHPAPLPECTKQYQPPNWKALPPAPDLKLSKVENGIVISWKIEGYQEDSYEEIASYQLYAYQETSSPPSTTLWKKIGDVKALPLPMACTLTQFMAGFKYYFAVRAVDIRSRLGPFSLPGSILLLNKM